MVCDCVDVFELAHEMDQWWANVAMNLRIQWEQTFTDQLNDYKFFKKDSEPSRPSWCMTRSKQKRKRIRITYQTTFIFLILILKK
jgi:hypothetical protein